MTDNAGEAVSGWRAAAREMLQGARDAVLRFPATTLALLALALDVNLLIADFRGAWSGNDALILPLFAAAAASLAVSIASEAAGLGTLPRHILAAAAGFAAFAIGYWDRVSGVSIWFFAAALTGLVLVAPAAAGRTGAACWLFAMRLFFALLLAFVALLLFAGGLSAILASLTYLFGLDLPGEAYGHVWAATGLFAAPLFALGRIPDAFDAEPRPEAAGFMNFGMRALGDFVAAPLLLVYALILHAYALKIVLTRDVPEGQIGWLVLAFGLCVFGSLILVHPFLGKARAPMRLLSAFWPFLLPVPLALLFYALGLRVGLYGLTPERYLLGLFGITATLLVLLQLPRRTRGDLRLLAGLPVLALLFGSFGPQGAMMGSVRNQAARFRDAVAVKPLDAEKNERALSALRFLEAHGATDRVAPMSVKAGATPKADLFGEVVKAYGLDTQAPLGTAFTRSFNQPAALSSEGFDIVVPQLRLFDNPKEEQAITLPSGRTLTFRLEQGAIVVSAGEPLRFPIGTAELRAIAAGTVNVSLPVRLTSGDRVLLIVPEFVYGDLRPKIAIRNITGTVLLRSADWR